MVQRRKFNDRLINRSLIFYHKIEKEIYCGIPNRFLKNLTRKIKMSYMTSIPHRRSISDDWMHNCSIKNHKWWNKCPSF